MAAVDLSNKRDYAIKVLDKRHIIREKKVKYVNIEKNVLYKLDHPGVVKLYSTFQDSSSLCKLHLRLFVFFFVPVLFLQLRWQGSKEISTQEPTIGLQQTATKTTPTNTESTPRNAQDTHTRRRKRSNKKIERERGGKRFKNAHRQTNSGHGERCFMTRGTSFGHASLLEEGAYKTSSIFDSFPTEIKENEEHEKAG